MSVVTVRSESATWRLVLPAPPTSDAQRHLARHGTAYEPAVVRALGLLLGPDDLLVDSRADVGDRCVPLVVRTGCRAVALERDPAALAALRATAGLDEIGGRLDVRDAGAATGGRGLDDLDLPGPVRALVVPSGDLEGAADLVGRDRPRLYVAGAPDELRTWARRAGYTYVATHAVPDRPAPALHELRPLRPGEPTDDAGWDALAADEAGEDAPRAAGGPPAARGLGHLALGVDGVRQLPTDGFGGGS